jgi:hypothetical protein
MEKNTDNKMLCLTIFSYKKPNLSDTAYRDYMLQTHAPLASTLMEKYGIVGFTMTHMNSQTRPLLTQITGPHFTNTADYDVVSQMMFRNVESFAAMLADPFYKENVMPDDKNFADMGRTRMSLGWIEDVVKDGRNLVLRGEGVGVKGSAVPSALKQKRFSDGFVYLLFLALSCALAFIMLNIRGGRS